MFTVIITACWLLGFAAVALAIAPDKSRPSASLLAYESASELEPQLVELTRPHLDEVQALRFAAALLSPASLAKVSPELVKARALDWAQAVERTGASPIDALGEILPSAPWFQTRLVTRRDEADLFANAKTSGEYGNSYTVMAKMLADTKANSSSLELALDEVWNHCEPTKKLDAGFSSILKRRDLWIPSKSALSASHQYALDVFFTSLKRHGAEEIGPTIHSISSGLVVSAAEDWKGGDRPSSYRGGGLSPNAGNGVIIYDPNAARYYAYFHLGQVTASVGQIVEAGQAIGKGGNTGINARKKGHGGHVRVEIHDVDGGAWTSYAIRDLLLSTY
ncbi:hypothetical protein MASR2M48_24740 [Spirochaetota bacterium]